MKTGHWKSYWELYMAYLLVEIFHSGWEGVDISGSSLCREIVRIFAKMKPRAEYLFEKILEVEALLVEGLGMIVRICPGIWLSELKGC